MKKIGTCPFCGHKEFNRKEISLVKMINEGDCRVDELLSGMLDECNYSCAKCGKEVTEEEIKFNEE